VIEEANISITNLFWLFFVLVSLQPAVRQKILEIARLRTLRRLEQKRGSRPIALIHRQETVALLGFSLFRYIDIDDSEQVLRAIRLTAPDVSIDLILHTPGGLVLAEDATELGLPVSTEMPQEVYDLMQLYSQTVQRRPSVHMSPSRIAGRDQRRPPPASGNSRCRCR
jgi:hypothetical protein